MRRLPRDWAWRLVGGLAWLGYLGCVAQLFALHAAGMLSPEPLFNIDTLFLADLQRDLAAGGRLADWSLPHALFLFPDVALWAIASLLGPSVPHAVLLFGALQAVGVAALTSWLLAREFGPRAGLLGPAAWAVVFLFISRGQLREALDLLKPNHHFGVTFTALLAFAGASRWLEQPRAVLLSALAGLLFVGSLSDPFALTCAAAPVVGVLLLAAVRRPGGRVATAGAAALLGVSAGLGHLLARALTQVGSDVGRLQPERLGEQWATLRRALATLDTSAPDLLGALGLLLLPLLFVRGVRGLAQPGLRAVLDVGPLLAVVANQASLLLTGNTVHVLFNRYQIVIFGLLVVTLARVGAWLLRAPAVRGLVGLGVTLACLVALTTKVPAGPRPALASWQPPGTECVVREAQRRDAWRGLSDVPTARPFTLLNGAGLRLEALEGGVPRWWLSTRRTFRDEAPPVAFALIGGLNHPGAVGGVFGPPSEVVACPPWQVWFWDGERRVEVTRRLTSLPPR